MINSLEEEIKHLEEAAEELENFENFKCEYCKLGREDGVWKETCRCPSNIPEGCSWGECSESNCPLFSNCLECAKEHRQLAEWLRELKDIKHLFSITEKLFKANFRGGLIDVVDGYDILFSEHKQLREIFEEVNADAD